MTAVLPSDPHDHQKAFRAHCALLRDAGSIRATHLPPRRIRHGNLERYAKIIERVLANGESIFSGDMKHRSFRRMNP